jgi:hypothetical protein
MKDSVRKDAANSRENFELLESVDVCAYVDETTLSRISFGASSSLSHVGKFRTTELFPFDRYFSVLRLSEFRRQEPSATMYPPWDLDALYNRAVIIYEKQVSRKLEKLARNL